MALAKFNAPTLPSPPAQYDPQYMRQLIRSIEIYHGQLDSLTPNVAESYSATFLMGILIPTGFTTVEKLALPAVEGVVIFDKTLQKLCVFTATGWETITSA